MAIGGPNWPWRTDSEGRSLLEVVPRWLRFTVGLGLLAIATGCMMIAAGGHDPDRWHVDPATAERTGKPNDYLVAPGGATQAPADRVLPAWSGTPVELIDRFDAVARAAPRVEVVAGGPEDLFVTYVQRSRWIGFPDYISVRAVPDGDGASLIVWSRSRYGHSDLGVNRARVDEWIAALGPPV